ncbi:MAG: NACHT domain-containing protein [Pseudonocardiaceae bacterium]
MAAITAERLKSGTLKDLLDVYGGLDSGRLIILGGPGTGKTSAAIRLLLDALRRRAVLGTAEERARVPVPLLFTLRGWDPNRKSFADWLADRLEHDYEFLAAREYGTGAAAQLINGNYLAVILDGLDEIPEGLRSATLRALDEQATFRLVVLTRSDELVIAVSGAHLLGAAALELCPVKPRQAAEYLASCQTDSLSPAWQRVVEELRDRPGSILAQALDTPLMVTLIRDTYRRGDPVDELIDSSRFASREAIEDHLLDRVLPIAYAQHPGRPTPPYTEDEARQWLTYLARHMNDEGTRDLAWWQIPRWVPVWSRALVTGLVVGLVGLLAFGLTSVFRIGLKNGLMLGLTSGLTYALVFGFVSVLGGGYSRQLGWLPWSRTDIRTTLMFGLTGGLVFGVSNWLVTWLRYGFAKGLMFGIVYGLLNILVVGVAFGFLNRLAGLSKEAASSIDPRSLWRRERWLGLKTGLVYGLTAGLMYGLANGLMRGLVLKAGLKASLVGGLGGGLVNALTFGFGVVLVSSTTWAATLASAQLRRRGQTYVRLLSFLEDARAREVLRCVGPVYQFRHARLQDRLAGVREEVLRVQLPMASAPGRASSDNGVDLPP